MNIHEHPGLQSELKDSHGYLIGYCLREGRRRERGRGREVKDT